MLPDSSTLYRALAARDTRFDGLFFVAVTSTKIYCRPICPARTPHEKNTRFFETAQRRNRPASGPACGAVPSWRQAARPSTTRGAWRS
jgi:AraC family transcriptional regulator of adaptative response / DNA-3-methyladenine glycosylase II